MLQTVSIKKQHLKVGAFYVKQVRGSSSFAKLSLVCWAGMLLFSIISFQFKDGFYFRNLGYNIFSTGLNVICALALLWGTVLSIKNNRMELMLFPMGFYQIDYVKQASANLKSILDSVSDKETKKKVEKVYDALYSSPVKSHPNLAQTESQILVSINELRGAVSGGNKDIIITKADSLLIEVNERNRQLQILN